MSSCIKKYIVHFDGNDGNLYHKEVYCKYEDVWDGQLWCNSDGSPVDFECVTDSYAKVMSMCIAGIVISGDPFCYWEEIKDFETPEAVSKSFNFGNDKILTQ